MKISKLVVTLFIGSLICLFTQHAFSQTEKLGVVNFTPPKGWTKTDKENIVAYSEINQAAGKFCIITLYGATPSTGKPESDFTRDWNERVVKTLGAQANPKTETEIADGWTMIAGGSAVDYQGTKAVVFLTVLSGYGKSVSILGLFNDEAYMSKLVAFNTSIEMDKTVAENPVVQPTAPVPQAPAATAATTMHVAALVKEFENNEVRANQQLIRSIAD